MGEYRKSAVGIVKHNFDVCTHNGSPTAFLHNQLIFKECVYMKQLLSLFASQVSIAITQHESDGYASESQVIK